MASDTGLSSRLIVRAVTAALLSFALLPPAYAQFWGNSWGRRQQQPQQRYNPYAQQPYNVRGLGHNYGPGHHGHGCQYGRNSEYGARSHITSINFISARGKWISY